jgi:hypothetical protein
VLNRAQLDYPSSKLPVAQRVAFGKCRSIRIRRFVSQDVRNGIGTTVFIDRHDEVSVAAPKPPTDGDRYQKQ